MILNDSHIHIFDGGYHHSSELVDYEVLRGEHRIAHTLVVGYEGEERFRGNNQYILELARTRSWMWPLAYLDVAATPDDVQRSLRSGARGFSLYLSNNDIKRVDDSIWAAFDISRAIVSINATPSDLMKLTQVLPRMPNATVLISHLGFPGAAQWLGMDEWNHTLELLRVHPRVMLKVSGLYAIDPTYPHLGAAPALAAAIRTFGPRRLLWGSDYPWGLDVVSADQLLSLPPWMFAHLDGGMPLVAGANFSRSL